MANTKISTMLATTAALTLAACGGGSSTLNNNPTVIVENNPTEISSNITTLKMYNDGAGVLSVTGTAENNVLTALNLQAAREVANGSIDLTILPNSYRESGTLYSISRTGVTSNGQSIRINTAGRNLNLSETEYASISYIRVNQNLALAAGASPVNGFPIGSHTYSGFALLVQNYDSNNDREGSFTMNTNFNNNTATIAATLPSDSDNPALFFSATDLSVNQGTGVFTTSNATVGIQNGATEAASIYGNFAGTNASGVSGLVYSNDKARANYAGAFYGTR